jgi:hypothetical protein
MIDRAGLSQALAKAIAYKLSGKDELAREWGAKLVAMLRAGGIV